VAPPALALTRKPVPGVLKTTPRGEVALKKSAGSGFGVRNTVPIDFAANAAEVSVGGTHRSPTDSRAEGVSGRGKTRWVSANAFKYNWRCAGDRTREKGAQKDEGFSVHSVNPKKQQKMGHI